jgi:phage virion morphogenesis protein
MTISIDVDDRRALDRIKALQRAAADMTPLFQTIGAGLLSNVQLGFKGSRSPYGQTWAPLKTRSGQPLRDTGRLQRSITAQPDDQGVTVGTNVSYAAIHQFGKVIKAKNKPFLIFKTPRGWVKKKSVTIPERPFFPITPDGETNLPAGWEKSVVTRIRAYFAKAGE